MKSASSPVFIYDFEADPFSRDGRGADVAWKVMSAEVLKRSRVLLTWIEAGYHETGDLASHLHRRGFDHIGSAVAWARRRIVEGHVYGDVVELELRDYSDPFGAEHVTVFDVVPKGVIPWEIASSGTQNFCDKRFTQGGLLKRVPLERDRHRNKSNRSKRIYR